MARLHACTACYAYRHRSEPDRFRSMRHRGEEYGYQAYVREVRALLRALDKRGLGPECINGPGTAGKWTEHLQQYAVALGERLRLIDVHTYGLHGCSASHRHRLTVSDLLLPSTVDISARKHHNLQRIARKLGRAYVIGEGNSISCSGVPRVSDAVAGMLWTVDALLSHASNGVARFNLHGGLNYGYNAVSFTSWELGAPPQVRAGYIGMFVAALAMRRRSQFIVTEQLRTAMRRVGRVHQTNADTESVTRKRLPYVATHALRDNNGGIRVVVIHKGVGAGATNVRVILPSTGLRTVTGRALAAPLIATVMRTYQRDGDFTATRGISIGGLTFDGSRDGLPLGKLALESVPLCAFFSSEKECVDVRAASSGDKSAKPSWAELNEANDGTRRGYQFMLNTAEIVVFELTAPPAIAPILTSLPRVAVALVVETGNATTSRSYALTPTRRPPDALHSASVTATAQSTVRRTISGTSEMTISPSGTQSPTTTGTNSRPAALRRTVSLFQIPRARSTSARRTQRITQAGKH